MEDNAVIPFGSTIINASTFTGVFTVDVDGRVVTIDPRTSLPLPAPGYELSPSDPLYAAYAPRNPSKSAPDPNSKKSKKLRGAKVYKLPHPATKHLGKAIPYRSSDLRLVKNDKGETVLKVVRIGPTMKHIMADYRNLGSIHEDLLFLMRDAEFWR